MYDPELEQNKRYFELNDLDKAMKMMSDTYMPVEDMVADFKMPADKIQHYRQHWQDLKKAPWEDVRTIASWYENYFPFAANTKVRDPEANEQGWAEWKDGKPYLTNTFKNFKDGDRLVLEDDNFTINVPATKALNGED